MSCCRFVLLLTLLSSEPFRTLEYSSKDYYRQKLLDHLYFYLVDGGSRLGRSILEGETRERTFSVGVLFWNDSSRFDQVAP